MANLGFMETVIVETLADLQALGYFSQYTMAYLLGKTTKGDGGQGMYLFDPSSEDTDTSATTMLVVKPATSMFPTGIPHGRWKRTLPDVAYPSLTVGSPASGSISVSTVGVGGGVYASTFTLTACRVSVTDAGASGSYGTLVLATLPQGGVSYLGCRQNYTAFAEGAALTGAAGDAVFDIGVGTVAKAAAADGALGGATDDNIGAEIAITLSGGTGAGTVMTGAGAYHDGTATAATLNLNWSGTAATIDASSTIDVTGTITVLWSMMGDD